MVPGRDTLPGSRLAPLAIALTLAAACVDTTQPPDSPPPEEPPGSEPAAREPGTHTAVIDTHRWSTRLRAGDGVSLINELGDVRARGSGDSGLHYVGVVQKLDGETRAPDFATNRLPEKMQLSVSAPSDWNGRVDASARVPAGSHIELRTADGLIEVKTGENDVSAVSKGGRIFIRTAGRIEARGETGDMLISMFASEFGEEDAGKVETVSGDIELWVQPDANLTLYADGGGGVSLNIANTATLVEATRNTAQVRFGDGAARFDVTTRQGTIRVNVHPVVE